MQAVNLNYSNLNFTMMNVDEVASQRRKTQLPKDIAVVVESQR